jgi:hypothetical protein
MEMYIYLTLLIISLSFEILIITKLEVRRNFYNNTDFMNGLIKF